MKKKIIGIAMIAAIALGAGWNVMESKSEVSLSDLALSNVEALARNESGSNGKALAQKSDGSYCCATLSGNTCNQSPDC